MRRGSEEVQAAITECSLSALGASACTAAEPAAYVKGKERCMCVCVRVCVCVNELCTVCAGQVFKVQLP